MQATNITNPTIDKRQIAQSIRILMDYAGIDWEEIKAVDVPKPQAKKGIPDAWERARGLLKGRGIDPIAYEDQIRSEWDNYP